jgi:hypothetical protein
MNALLCGAVWQTSLSFQQGSQRRSYPSLQTAVACGHVALVASFAETKPLMAGFAETKHLMARTQASPLTESAQYRAGLNGRVQALLLAYDRGLLIPCSAPFAGAAERGDLSVLEFMCSAPSCKMLVISEEVITVRALIRRVLT